MEAHYTRALFRATQAGANILGKHTTHGNLSNGKLANFIVVNFAKRKKSDTPETILKNLMSPYKKDRESYKDLVFETYFEGRDVYVRS